MNFFQKSTLDVAHLVHFYWQYRLYIENTTQRQNNSFQLGDIYSEGDLQIESTQTPTLVNSLPLEFYSTS